MIIERPDNSAIRPKIKYDQSNLRPSRVFSIKGTTGLTPDRGEIRNLPGLGSFCIFDRGPGVNWVRFAEIGGWALRQARTARRRRRDTWYAGIGFVSRIWGWPTAGIGFVLHKGGGGCLFGIAFGDGVLAGPSALGRCASLRSPALGMTRGGGNWVRFAL